MSNLFYPIIENFDMFDNLISKQSDNPTKQLNLMLRHGTTKNQLEIFLKKGLSKQFSINGKGWSGIRNHIHFCEKNGWKFSSNFDDFLSSNDKNAIFKIVGFNTMKKKNIYKKSKQKAKNQKLQTEKLNSRLFEILHTVKKRIQYRVNSLDAVFKFKRSGIEAWFKVEVVAALGDQVISLNNRGPDITLKDGLLIELKAATDFNPSYYRDGALKDNVPCLFLGNGESKKNINKLKSMKQIHIIDIVYIFGLHTWVIGCIVPVKYKI